MLRKISTVVVFTMLFFACSKELNDPIDIVSNDLMSKEEINQFLYADLEANGIFKWDRADTKLMYSAAMQSDSLFAIGYQIAGMQDLPSKIHEIDIESAEWMAARDKVLQLVLEGEQELDPNKEVADLLPHGNPEVLPTMAVLMTNPATIEKLRNMEEVRYLEAMGYELPPISDSSTNATQRSGSGCDDGYARVCSLFSGRCPGTKSLPRVLVLRSSESPAGLFFIGRRQEQAASDRLRESLKK